MTAVALKQVEASERYFVMELKKNNLAIVWQSRAWSTQRYGIECGRNNICEYLTICGFPVRGFECPTAEIALSQDRAINCF